MHLDRLAVRVVRRYLAEVGPGRRVAIEYQRRRHGLERVEHENEEGGPNDRERLDDE
jgi:hypothetical protein